LAVVVAAVTLPAPSPGSRFAVPRDALLQQCEQGEFWWGGDYIVNYFIDNFLGSEQSI